MAYWLTSASMAALAACFSSGGQGKSGNPWARLIASCSSASRVISRMTDSVNDPTLPLTFIPESPVRRPTCRDRQRYLTGNGTGPDGSEPVECADPAGADGVALLLVQLDGLLGGGAGLVGVAGPLQHLGQTGERLGAGVGLLRFAGQRDRLPGVPLGLIRLAPAGQQHRAQGAPPDLAVELAGTGKALAVQRHLLGLVVGALVGQRPGEQGGHTGQQPPATRPVVIRLSTHTSRSLGCAAASGTSSATPPRPLRSRCSRACRSSSRACSKRPCMAAVWASTRSTAASRLAMPLVLAHPSAWLQ